MTTSTDQARPEKGTPTTEAAFKALDRLPTALKDELQSYIADEVDRRVEATIEEAWQKQVSEPPLWTVKQVANYLNIGKRTAEKIIAAGDLKYVKVRGQRRFDRKTVFAYARNNVH